MNYKHLILLIIASLSAEIIALAGDFPGPEPDQRPLDLNMALNNIPYATQVYPTNIEKMPLVVKVQPDWRGNSKDFTVIVDPEARRRNVRFSTPPQTLDSGALMVGVAGQGVTHGIIVNCFVQGRKVSSDDKELHNIKKEWLNRGIVFRFTVDTNYLTLSRFFICHSNVEDPLYVVHLDEFARSH
jgi:hypothetical protein